MSKKKIGIIAGVLAAVVLVLVGVNFYAKGDHSGPSVTLAADFEIGYGERIGLFDLVTAVSDESEYTISITAGGNVAADGRSTVFDRAGDAQVEITAVDELGHTTVKTAAVKITDTKPPMLRVKDMEISLGDPVDYHTGITAEDEMDGNLTSQIQVDLSQVDETKAGIYPVTYSVSDSSGNQAVVRSALII
ncbi:MAG: immunoglobulin-like domain-containing protein, partial [Candidatus Onthomonas sp.]